MTARPIHHHAEETPMQDTSTTTTDESGERVIWKFTVDVTDDPVIEVPVGAEFIPHVHAVNALTLWVWAKVDPQLPTERRTLHIRGTGHPHFETLGSHLGTVVIEGGMLVWHVFEGLR
jgi:hypothetical protein